MNKKWLIAIIIIIIIVIVSYLSFSLLKTKEVELETGKIEYRDIIHKTVITGSILPGKEVEIKSPVSGILEEIYVRTGEKVVAGQKLARVKLIPDPENLSNAESVLKRARLNLQQAENNYQRYKQLYEGQVISKSEYEQHKTDYELKSEEVKAAETRVELIREGVAREFRERSNIITSTLEGTVLGVNVLEGGSIMGRGAFSEGTTILVIADMNLLEFRGKVGESDVNNLELGMNLQLTIGALQNESIEAVLGYISPKGQSEEGTVKFDIAASIVPDEKLNLRAGYSATADIILKKSENVPAIPEKWLIFRNDSSFLNVKTQANNYIEKAVVTGMSDGLYIEIISGIGEEDEIVK